MSQQLRVLLISSPDNLNILRSDFQNLSNTVNTLPCNIQADFQNRLVLRAQHTAATYFGHERVHDFSAVCEFPQNYFDDPEQTRLLILLHELIHACQRQTVLRRWDERTMNKLKEYRVLSDVGLQIAPPQQRPQLQRNATAQINLFHEYFEIIFEAWNHLFMKENYPELFEQQMTIVHKRKSSAIEKGYYDDWGEGHMFHAHVKLLEATFFSKITEGFSINNKFQELVQIWRDKLRKICDMKQFQKLNSVVDAMTRTNEYDNSETLELQYLTMCECVRERTVFD